MPPRAEVVAKHLLQGVRIFRQDILGEDRIAQFLEFCKYLVIYTRILVVGPSKQHQSNLVFPFQHVQHLSGFTTDKRLVQAAKDFH